MHGLILDLNTPPLGNPWGESIHLGSGFEDWFEATLSQG